MSAVVIQHPRLVERRKFRTPLTWSVSIVASVPLNPVWDLHERRSGTSMLRDLGGERGFVVSFVPAGWLDAIPIARLESTFATLAVS